MAKQELEEFKATGEDSATMDPVVPAGGAVKKRKADLKKSADPVADEIEDTVKTPQGKAAMSKAPARLADKNVKESLSEIFGDLLSEENVDRAATLLEAAMNEREAEIREHYEALVEQQVEERIEEVVESVDAYMANLTDRWLEENAVAIESSLKVAMAENLISGLQTLFVENNVAFDDDSADLISDLSNAHDALEEKLNAALNDNIALAEELEAVVLGQIIAEETADMVDTDADRVRTMMEDVDYRDADHFREKVRIVVETYFKEDDKAAPLTESVDRTGIDPIDPEDAPATPSQYPNVDRYADSISTMSRM